MQIEPLQTITRLELSDCDLSPDGQAVAAIYQEDGGLHLGAWSAIGCDQLLDLDLRGTYTRPRFDPDGRRLAAGRGGEQLTVWSLAEGKALFTLERDGDAPLAAYAFGRHGETIAVAQGDRLSFWDIEGARWQATLPLPAEIQSLRSSPDGRMLAVGLVAGGAVIVEWQGRDIRANLPEITQPVTALAFHPERPWLLTALGPTLTVTGRRVERAEHGWARVWSYRTGEEIVHIPCDYEAVFLGQGRYVATITDNSRSLWVWQILPAADLVAHVENAVPERMVDERGYETRRVSLSATPQGDLLAVSGLTRPISPVGALHIFAFRPEAVPQPS